ncbi:MAG: hypothetical protein AAF492_19865, partial [Verrucomicrobiota bacterium]
GGIKPDDLSPGDRQRPGNNPEQTAADHNIALNAGRIDNIIEEDSNGLRGLRVGRRGSGQGPYDLKPG